MKKIILVILACLTVITSQAQLSWESIPSIPVTGRKHGVYFEAAGKMYVGLGMVPSPSGFAYSNELWEYNPSNQVWTKKADFPGIGVDLSTSFTINDIGYVGGGTGASGVTNTFYKYNPKLDKWTSIANYPGGVKFGMSSAVIKNIAYVGLGAPGGTSTYTNTLYSYTPSTNSWAKKSSFPGGKSIFATTFVIGNKAYFGCVVLASQTLSNKFWSYDKTTNKWSSIATMPGTTKRNCSGFSRKGKGYVGLGVDTWHSPYNFLNAFHEYDPATNKWKSVSSNTNIAGRFLATIVNIGDSIIIFGASRGKIDYLTDFWQLKTTSDTCDYYDTTKITAYDTITTFVFDTIIITQLDTITTQVYDTVVTLDTTFITKYDTITTQIFDTTVTRIFDTTFITKYDTLITQVFDTTFYTKYDTVIINKIRSVTDTLRIILNENGVGCIVSLKIYPNPAKDKVYLHSSRDDCYPDAKVELIDVLGQVLQTKPNSKLVSFDIRGYSRALYFIRLVDSNGNTIFTKKILIE